MNAAFLAKVDPDSKVVQDKPKIVFGGISNDFVHASSAENYLDGKNLKAQDILQGTFKVLDSEISPDQNPSHATVEYRKHLAKALFYKVKLIS